MAATTLSEVNSNGWGWRHGWLYKTFRDRPDCELVADYGQCFFRTPASTPGSPGADMTIRCAKYLLTLLTILVPRWVWQPR
jgi:hypothetical protein